MSKRKLSVVVHLLVCSAVLAVALSMPSVSLAQTTIIRYAKPSATGTGDCLSWANACTLQTALTNSASGDEIWVQAGTYKPGASGNTAATFQLKSGVAIYGGFVGTENNLADRDFVNHVTTLSGDLDSSGDHTGADAYHVVTASGVDTTAVLEGFTITAGNANFGCMPTDGGAGLHSINGSPTLRNLIFIHNSARQLGGGTYFEFSAPVLTNITFISNTALYGGGAALVGGAAALSQITFTDNAAIPDGAGGGMMIEQSGQVTLKDVTFNNNWAVDGGGMEIAFYANPTLENVTFNNNYADWKGGGVYVYYYSLPRLKNVAFRQNYARESGGGLMTNNHSAVTFMNGTFGGNTAGYAGGGIYENHGSYSSFVNVLFTGNHSQGYSGGGAEIGYGNLGSHTTFINTTFTGNTAGVNGGGGIYIAYGSQITLTNSILWGNTTTTSIYRAHQIGHFEDPWNSGQVIVNNDIEEGFWGTDIISSDPLLVDANGADNIYGTADDNAHLQAGSPVISLGNLAWLPADQADLDGDGNVTEKIPYDLDGRPRLINVLDLGAYEAGAVWYVDDNGVALNGCTTWTDACPDLQTALGKATSGDEIWVAAGTYKPGASGLMTATFQLKSGVAVYGGFNGSGSSRTDRNWLAQPTILSGDLDGSNSLTANDAYHVVTGINGATLDGFIVTGGNAVGGAPHNAGGGLYNAASSPTLRQIVFIGNAASTSGGGMYNAGSSPLLANILFSGNSAGTGGGLANASGSNPSLYNVTFSGNAASVSGGGVYNLSSTLALRNSVLWGNTAPTQSQIANTTSTVNIFYSDIQGALSGGNWDTALGTDGGGNLDADPLFADANGADDVYGTLDDNARQQPGSPVINAGSNAQLPADAGDVDGDGDTSETLPYDLDGRPRLEGRVVDMGGYERGEVGPTISAILAQVINEDTTTAAIPFTIGDNDTPLDLLTLSTATSSPTLVPLPNIVLGGTGGTRTVTLTPTANQFGQAVITITVSDGSLTANTSFTLTVNSINDRPTISTIVDQYGYSETPITIPFTIGDVETLPAALQLSVASSNLTVAPLSNLAFGGSDAARTLIFTATAQLGTSAITVTVSDGDLSASKSFTLTVAGTAGTRYVKPTGVSTGVCRSWETACTLTQALAVALSGDEIWVAVGTYRPGASGVNTATFQLKEGVGVYGGFTGTETIRTDRNWVSNLTVLSGDLDNSGGRNTNDAYHVVTGNGLTSLAVLDGFTITSGNAPGSENGGGMYLSNSNPTLSNLIFNNNYAGAGGGLYTQDSSPALSNVTFTGNSATYNGGGYQNAGNAGGAPTLKYVIFENNSSVYGGGFYSYGAATLDNVIFRGNVANSGMGGGMLIDISNPTLRNVVFVGNVANGGAGIYTWDGDPILINVTFVGNTVRYGGAGGGMYNRSYSHPTVINSIFWNNTAGSGVAIADEMDSASTVTYSDVQGGFAGTGNQNVNPLFVDADGADNTYGTADDDPRLAANSPLIDAGHPTQCPVTDIRGLPRTDLRCDMGAYEVKYPDSHTVIRSVGDAITTTFGPALVGIQRDAVVDPGVIMVTKSLTWKTKPANAIDAYWLITPTITSGFNLTLTLCYTPTESNGLDLNALRFWRYSANQWHAVAGTPLTSIVGINQCATLSGITELSAWTLATDTPTAITLNDLSARASSEAASAVVLALLSMVWVIGGGVWFKWQARRR